MTVVTGIACVSLAGWLYLCFLNGAFWRIERGTAPPQPREWPAIAAVVPARNEEALIGETIRSLLAQDYPGALRVVVVDDRSGDATASAARAAAEAAGRAVDLELVCGAPLPQGWVGKVWAMSQGVARAEAQARPPRYILFSDADIAHCRSAVRALVCRAEAGSLDLASFMVRLHCRTAAERLMIPAFVFFFRMLYPFRLVNDPRSPVAGAAGGTMLVRREALGRIGGLAAIRGALIDDCALARAIKAPGHPIWIGLSLESRSLRVYRSLPQIVDMIARTAYHQLGCSPLRLAGCVLGMALLFAVPPAFTLAARLPAASIAAGAWALLSLLYTPMLREYSQPLWLAPLLPVTALVYVWATILSAWRRHRRSTPVWRG